MKKLDIHKAFAELCKATGKWGLYISWVGTAVDVIDAAPYLHQLEDGQILLDGQGIILCDSEKECYNLYDQTVGDDGPTSLNSYDGPDKVYALTCNPSGQLQSENT